MGLREDVTEHDQPLCGVWPAGVVTLAAMACVLGMAGAAALTGVPFSTVSRDPATALGGPFITGYLSYLGASLWCAAAAVTLFAWKVARKPYGGTESKSRFLLYAGLLTAVLGADDLFMLHDGLIPYVVADVEHALLAVYGLALLVVIVLHREDVWRTNTYLLAAAVACFSAACLIDAELVRPGEARRHLFEDGFKFLGITNWSAWLILASASTVRDGRAMAGACALPPVLTQDNPRVIDEAEPSERAGRSMPTRIGLLLAAIALFMTAAGAVGQWLRHAHGIQRSFGFIHQFGPDHEANLASWYSSAVMLLCAALLGFVGHSATTAWTRRRWWGLAALFVAMSADEVAQIHEMTIEPLRAMLGVRGALYFAWVVPGVLFAALVAVLSLRFLRELPTRTRRLFLAAGATYLAGALGVEMAGGWYAENHGIDALSYAFVSVAEEALELGGLVLFAYALCDYVSRAGMASPRQFAPAAGAGDLRGS